MSGTDAGGPPSGLPCLDGRHDFGSRYSPQDKTVHCHYRCARCGWYLERIVKDHPLRDMAHLFCVARRLSGDGAP